MYFFALNGKLQCCYLKSFKNTFLIIWSSWHLMFCMIVSPIGIWKDVLFVIEFVPFWDVLLLKAVLGSGLAVMSPPVPSFDHLPIPFNFVLFFYFTQGLDDWEKWLRIYLLISLMVYLIPVVVLILIGYKYSYAIPSLSCLYVHNLL